MTYEFYKFTFRKILKSKSCKKKGDINYNIYSWYYLQLIIFIILINRSQKIY